MKRFIKLTGKVNQQPRKPGANERKTLDCSGVAANTTGQKCEWSAEGKLLTRNKIALQYRTDVGIIDEVPSGRIVRSLRIHVDGR